jgi:hypothetical protein
MVWKPVYREYVMTIKLLGTGLTDLYYPDSTLDYALASRFKAVASGSSNTFKVYAGALGDIKCAVYADSGGSPGAKVYGDDTARTISSYVWQDVVFSGALFDYDTYYWLVIRQNAAGIVYLDYESGGSLVSAPLPWANSWPSSLSWGTPTADYSYGLAVWGVEDTPGTIGGILPNI